jgi:GNAT superfamily N-acetyltransferase
MNEDFKIVPAEEAGDQVKLTELLIDIDYKCFPGVGEEDEGTAEKWTAISDASFAHVVFEKDIPIGYIDFVSLKPEGVKKLLSGTLRDGDIPDFADTKNSKSLILYIVVIAIVERHRGKGFSKLLWNKSREYFFSKGLDIKNIYATVWTDKGWDFFSHFNIELKNKDEGDHRIIEIKTENNNLPLYK